MTPGTLEGPDQEGWNSRITVTNAGRVSAEVQYGHMEKYSKKREVHFDSGIIVDFYNQSGNHTSKLTAERGLLFEVNNDFEAHGNVVVVSDSGITLLSESLKWQNQRQRILTDDFVTVSTADADTLHGKGFESDPNLKNWSIKQTTGVTKRRLNLPRAKRSEKSRPEPVDSLQAAPPDSLQQAP